MKHILLFGAGKSATSLIAYLLANAAAENWHITIADINTDLILSKTKNVACSSAVAIDIKNDAERNDIIKHVDIVISLMPPHLHLLIAQSCIALQKNLLTASYVDEQLRALEKEVIKNDLLFLCEMGLDPGIDHMSAMQLIDKVNANGGAITSFKSHCGGLVAPESDNNPWHYKISWNPRNIVMAGSAGATYMQNGKVLDVPYEQMYTVGNKISNANYGQWQWYPNRNSLPYQQLYNLPKAATFIRTTLRHPSFCNAWAAVVALQLTSENDYEIIKNCTTYKDWYLTKKAISPYNVSNQVYGMFDWLGIIKPNKIKIAFNSSADLLQYLLEHNLVLAPGDKDLVVMVHELELTYPNSKAKIESWLVVTGTNNSQTAMAKTVGLPLGIAAKLILNGTINAKGIHIPILKEIYEPVLAELANNGIVFKEETTTLN
jgi:saccharopine dehydrogenase-like NADP-dependent oxidoreductase